MKSTLKKDLLLQGLAAVMLFTMGCMSVRETNTARTPEEQILLSQGVDRALATAVPSGAGVVGKKVFVDVTNLDCTDKAYVTDAVRQQLSQKGAFIVEKIGDADTIVTVRAGMLATQSGSSLIGVPSIKAPLVVSSVALETPEIAFFKHTSQSGRVKLCLTAYDSATRKLLETHEGEARTYFDRWHFMFVRNYERTNVPELNTLLISDK